MSRPRSTTSTTRASPRSRRAGSSRAAIFSTSLRTRCISISTAIPSDRSSSFRRRTGSSSCSATTVSCTSRTRRSTPARRRRRWPRATSALVRPYHRGPMGDFYADWLRESAHLESAVGSGPVVARGHELSWIETAQDARVAMLIGEATGFPTQGTALLKADIPAGWRTGRHMHGEEAMHILDGTGFSVIDGARYDWKPGTTLHVPYGAAHQHVNTGSSTAAYISALTTDLDFAVKLGRLEQLEEKARDRGELAARVPTQTSQFAADGRRIALHLEDAIDERARRLSGHA